MSRAPRAKVIDGAPRAKGWRYKAAGEHAPEQFIDPDGVAWRKARSREKATLIVQTRRTGSRVGLVPVVKSRRRTRRKNAGNPAQH